MGSMLVRNTKPHPLENYILDHGNEEQTMSNVGGVQELEWKVHTLFRLPLHNNECRICQEYRDHTNGMDIENFERVAQDMARVWGKRRGGESPTEEKSYREEYQAAQGEIERLNRQLEESKRSAEIEVERLKKEVEELKESAESRAMVSMSASEHRIRLLSPGPAERQIKAPRAVSTADIITQSNPVPTRRIGRADIVGFGLNGVTILRNSVCQPLTPKLEIADFGHNAGGWRVDQHVRLVGDTTGDGLGDIIGFGDAGVYVSRNNGVSFSSPTLVLQDFCSTTGWSSQKHVRYVADLRGQGYVDIIGFGDEGVFVSLNNGDGTFAPPHLVLDDYGLNGGWRLHKHLRFLADVNGNGILDIVAFGDIGVHISLGQGDGSFAPRKIASADFEYPAWDICKHTRTLADLTGDGRPDIIGLGQNGVLVSLNNGDGTFQVPTGWQLSQFSTSSGVGSEIDKNLLFVADVNGDGLGDLVVFGKEGVWVAIGNGDGTFQNPRLAIRDFGYRAGGWRIDQHSRFVVDLTGNGTADIVGFGDNTWVSYNDGRGNFGTIKKLVAEFGTGRGWGMNNTVRWFVNLHN